MNYVERAFNVSVEEYKLRKEGKIPKKSLEEFLKELDEEDENNDY